MTRRNRTVQLLLFALPWLLTGCTLIGYHIGSRTDERHAVRTAIDSTAVLRVGEDVEVQLVDGSRLRAVVIAESPGDSLHLRVLIPAHYDSRGLVRPVWVDSSFAASEVWSTVYLKRTASGRVSATIAGFLIDSFLVSIAALFLVVLPSIGT